jgi:hypothetical protein
MHISVVAGIDAFDGWMVPGEADPRRGVRLREVWAADDRIAVDVAEERFSFPEQFEGLVFDALDLPGSRVLRVCWEGKAGEGEEEQR